MCTCMCMCIVKVKALVTQSCPTLCDPMDCGLPGSSVHGILQNTGVGCHFLLQGIKPRFPALQADSLPSEPPGKPISYCEPCRNFNLSVKHLK